MKCLIGFVAVFVVFAKAPDSPVPNRAPLQQNAFYPLPLGAVKPAGWLKQKLRFDADELILKGDEWKKSPYYMDGLLPAAYLLGDQTLIAKAREWVDTAISQEPTTDWWPNMVTLKVLTQYYDATGDERILPALEKYFAHHAKELEANPLRESAQHRWGDELASILWLYNRNGNANLLDFARKLSAQAADTKPESLDGVNNVIGLKTSALWWLVSGESADREASRGMIGKLDQFHGLPDGSFAPDRDPSQSTESCAVAEQMYSLEYLIQTTGDPHLANRLERLAFNALPASSTKVRSMNQTRLSSEEANNACTVGMHQAWPKFTANLWMGTADQGLAAVAYSPSEVQTTAGGTAVRITEETNYPFSEEIVIKVNPSEPASFPLKLRIPGWTSNVVIRVNGASQRDIKPGTFFTIRREWREGDTVLIRLPMPVMVSHGFHGAVVVSRGPLLYSLAVQPRSLWNYALVINQKDPQGSFSVQMKQITSAPPFSREGTPVEIRAKGLPARQWKAVEAPPENPVKVSGLGEDIALIPYGASKLRITEFPEIVK